MVAGRITQQPPQRLERGRIVIDEMLRLQVLIERQNRKVLPEQQPCPAQQLPQCSVITDHQQVDGLLNVSPCLAQHAKNTHEVPGMVWLYSCTSARFRQHTVAHACVGGPEAKGVKIFFGVTALYDEMGPTFGGRPPSRRRRPVGTASGQAAL